MAAVLPGRLALVYRAQPAVALAVILVAKLAAGLAAAREPVSAARPALVARRASAPVGKPASVARPVWVLSPGYPDRQVSPAKVASVLAVAWLVVLVWVVRPGLVPVVVWLVRRVSLRRHVHF